MKKRLALLAAALLGASTLTFAASEKSEPAPKAEAPSPADAALIEKAKATYPLKTCLVSGEELGSMGDATPYVHREAGKPDRVVFFCCDSCIEDFQKEPAKYLKKVDDAAAAAKPEHKH